MSYLVANSEDRFSRDEAHFMPALVICMFDKNPTKTEYVRLDTTFHYKPMGTFLALGQHGRNWASVDNF